MEREGESGGRIGVAKAECDEWRCSTRMDDDQKESGDEIDDENV